jgi:hypothetical protein
MVAAKWILRPSALRWHGYPTAHRLDLEKRYQNDNKSNHDVQIPTPAPNRCFRVCQWNVHTFRYNHGDTDDDDDDDDDSGRSFLATAKAISTILLEHDPDAIVLNEFYAFWADAASETCSSVLSSAGYHAQAADGFPTVVFTRWHVEWNDSCISLGTDRAAVALNLRRPIGKDGGCPSRILLYGAHLCPYEDRDGHRLDEMKELVNHMQEGHSRRNEMPEAKIPTLIVGDLNQQRKADYLLHEWQLIRDNKERRRRETLDDGVDTLLQKDHGFVCGWDVAVRRNWTDGQPPPSTHWSGTVIDYVYARHLTAHGVYVSPSGLSDHRLCVSDWLLPQSEETCSLREQ